MIINDLTRIYAEAHTRTRGSICRRSLTSAWRWRSRAGWRLSTNRLRSRSWCRPPGGRLRPCRARPLPATTPWRRGLRARRREQRDGSNFRPAHHGGAGEVDPRRAAPARARRRRVPRAAGGLERAHVQGSDAPSGKRPAGSARQTATQSPAREDETSARSGANAGRRPNPPRARTKPLGWRRRIERPAEEPPAEDADGVVRLATSPERALIAELASEVAWGSRTATGGGSAEAWGWSGSGPTPTPRATSKACAALRRTATRRKARKPRWRPSAYRPVACEVAPRAVLS